jgi:hypothetical protein
LYKKSRIGFEIAQAGDGVAEVFKRSITGGDLYVAGRHKIAVTLVVVPVGICSRLKQGNADMRRAQCLCFH